MEEEAKIAHRRQAFQKLLPIIEEWRWGAKEENFTRKKKYD